MTVVVRVQTPGDSHPSGRNQFRLKCYHDNDTLVHQGLFILTLQLPHVGIEKCLIEIAAMSGTGLVCETTVFHYCSLIIEATTPEIVQIRETLRTEVRQTHLAGFWPGNRAIRAPIEQGEQNLNFPVFSKQRNSIWESHAAFCIKLAMNAYETGGLPAVTHLFPGLTRYVRFNAPTTLLKPVGQYLAEFSGTVDCDMTPVGSVIGQAEHLLNDPSYGNVTELHKKRNKERRRSLFRSRDHPPTNGRFSQRCSEVDRGPKES